MFLKLFIHPTTAFYSCFKDNRCMSESQWYHQKNHRHFHLNALISKICHAKNMPCQCHDVQCHHHNYFRLNKKIAIKSGGPFIFCMLCGIQSGQHTFQWWPDGADCVRMSRIRGETVAICSFDKEHQRNIKCVIGKTIRTTVLEQRWTREQSQREMFFIFFKHSFLFILFFLTKMQKKSMTTNMVGNFCIICFWTYSAGACEKSVFLGFFLFIFFIILSLILCLFWWLRCWIMGMLKLETKPQMFVMKNIWPQPRDRWWRRTGAS